MEENQKSDLSLDDEIERNLMTQAMNDPRLRAKVIKTVKKLIFEKECEYNKDSCPKVR